MKEVPRNELLSEIIQKPYETRTHSDHRIITHLIASTIPHCTLETAKKLSFFIEELTPEHQIPFQSILLLRGDKNSEHFQQIIYHHQPSTYSALAASTLTLIIPGKALRKCDVMSSIQEEIKCLQNSDYLSEVPKKRFYSVIKQAQSVLLCYGEQVFSSGEVKNRHDVFFARKGEFCYQVKDAIEDKHIQLFTFKEGHLFSQTSFEDHHQQVEEDELLESRQRPESHHQQQGLQLSVRCKSSKGIIYRFSREFFASHLLRYCESALKANTDRLNKLLQQRAQYVQEHRKVNGKLLTQKIPRSLSVELLALRAEKIATSRKGSVPKEPEPVLNIQEKPHDYKTLKNQQLPRNKLYSKAELTKLTFNPQKNESDLLLWKKSKCLRLKQLSRSQHPPLSKAETMLEFIKFTVQFQKTRRKPSIL